MKRGNSGVKFKDLGSSPAKQEAIENATRKARNLDKKLDTNKKFDIGGYFRGEQGWIPDYKGKSTKQSIHDAAKKVVEYTADTENIEEPVKGRMMMKELKLLKPKDFDEKVVTKLRPIEKRLVPVEEKMNVPYAYPGGPRVESFPLSKEEFTKGMLEGAIASGMGKVSGGMKKGKKRETND